jgi:hypothetical protein
MLFHFFLFFYVVFYTFVRVNISFILYGVFLSDQSSLEGSMSSTSLRGEKQTA